MSLERSLVMYLFLKYIKQSYCFGLCNLVFGIYYNVVDNYSYYYDAYNYDRDLVYPEEVDNVTKESIVSAWLDEVKIMSHIRTFGPDLEEDYILVHCYW